MTIYRGFATVPVIPGPVIERTCNACRRRGIIGQDQELIRIDGETLSLCIEFRTCNRESAK